MRGVSFSFYIFAPDKRIFINNINLKSMKSFITKLGLTVMMACLFSVAPVSAQDVMSPAQMKELAKQQKIAEKQQKQLGQRCCQGRQRSSGRCRRGSGKV